jgi:acyl-CoA synthetase (NDP forming)
VGAEIFHNLAHGGFAGQVFPVNPDATTVDGTTAYPSVREIPGVIDLAVIAVPAAAVPGAVDDCIACRVGAIVVISAGVRWQQGRCVRERPAGVLGKGSANPRHPSLSRRGGRRHQFHGNG